jgi:hypothetical protein
MVNAASKWLGQAGISRVVTQGGKGGTGDAWRGGCGILPRREVTRLSSGRLGAGGNARHGMAGEAWLARPGWVGRNAAG